MVAYWLQATLKIRLVHHRDPALESQSSAQHSMQTERETNNSRLISKMLKTRLGKHKAAVKKWFYYFLNQVNEGASLVSTLGQGPMCKVHGSWERPNNGDIHTSNDLSSHLDNYDQWKYWWHGNQLSKMSWLGESSPNFLPTLPPQHVFLYNYAHHFLYIHCWLAVWPYWSLMLAPCRAWTHIIPKLTPIMNLYRVKMA